MEDVLTAGAYEGHDCFPEEEPTEVVAICGGERIIAVAYESGPDVLMSELF